MKLVNRHYEQLLLRSLSSLWEKYRDQPPDQALPVAELHRQLEALVRESITESLTPQTRKFGVLVSDLRGFTAIGEHYPPLAVAGLLNRYYQAMIRVIDSHGGIVDKFMGDSVMAVFDSKGMPDAAERLLSCVIDMQLAMDGVNEGARELDMPEIFMGIGLGYGDMVVCELGSDIYRELTVLGDQVNLASRLTAFCLRGQVLMSNDMYRMLSDRVVAGRMYEVHVKGKAAPLCIHEVLGQKKPKEKLLPVRDVRKHYRVRVDLPVTYFAIDGKQVDSRVVHGRIADISYEGMRIVTMFPHAVMDEIKIVIAFITRECSNEIYARVLHCREEAEGLHAISVEFTYLDTDTGNALRVFVDHLAH